MKKFFQILGICSILVFSFYYTDQIALLVQKKNPVLQEIEAKKDSLKKESIDATIMNEYIIPGVVGSEVNVEKSFYKMKALNSYNEYYLVYNEITPAISIENNKDKIIISGNKSKKQISIILDYNNNYLNYFSQYNVNLLMTKDNYQNNLNFELINNELNSKSFKQLNTLLDRDKKNKNLCLDNEYNKEICFKNNNYIIKNTHKLTSNNLIEVKNSLENGSIILIDKSAKIDDIKVLLKQIKFQDLNIVYLSELIKE